MRITAEVKKGNKTVADLIVEKTHIFDLAIQGLVTAHQLNGEHIDAIEAMIMLQVDDFFVTRHEQTLETDCVAANRKGLYLA